MKKSRNIYILSFLFMMCMSSVIHSEEDIMNEIRNNTEQTAKHTKKGEYEYLAIMISLLALIVALWTFYYTKKTYKSQEATATNTIPKFTKQNQRDSFHAIADKLLENYIKSLAIRIILLKSENNRYVAPVNFVSQLVSLEGIHLESFYSDKKEDRYYERNIYGLKEELLIYNRNLDLVAKELSDPALDFTYKMSLFDTMIFFKPIEILTLMKNCRKDSYENTYDLEERIFERVMFMKDILTGKDVSTEKRLTDDDLDEEYIELINEMLDKNLYLWRFFFENKEDISSNDELKAFLMNISIGVLYYLSDKNDKFKILMRSYSN